ncbi:MAG TPA: ABC transporter ATP-binding protein [Xanthobacteraceae bacterium]|jgi:branched-chain amino acid transport system ATP-binding protein
MSILRTRSLAAFYDRTQVLHDLNLRVEEGEIVGLVGANGAGKSSTLFSIMGLKTRTEGELWLDGERIDHLPAYERVRRALVLIPERRHLFPLMSVLENLELGAYLPGPRKRRNATLEKVFELLPVLAERRHQVAGSLSGGEQQMCAIGRALMACPRLLMLDEPTEGLAPLYVERLFELMQQLRSRGITIIVVEQNVHDVLSIADRGYVLENGHVVLEDTGRRLLQDTRLKTAYLGL